MAEAETQEEVELTDGMEIPEDPEVEEEAPAEEAAPTGYLSQKEWEDAGNDPDEWMPKGAYNQLSSLRRAVKDGKREAKEQKKSIAETIARNNRYHEQQAKLMENDISKLTRELEEAVSLADSEGARRIQQDIDDTRESINALKAPVDIPVASESEALDQWNADNPWINETTPKASYAKAVYGQALAANTDLPYEDAVEAAIAATDKAVAEEYPAKNENRRKASASMRGKSSHKVSTGKTLKMSDLTSKEQEGWDTFKGYYKDEAEYLATVQEGRV